MRRLVASMACPVIIKYTKSSGPSNASGAVSRGQQSSSGVNRALTSDNGVVRKIQVSIILRIEDRRIGVVEKLMRL